MARIFYSNCVRGSLAVLLKQKRTIPIIGTGLLRPPAVTNFTWSENLFSSLRVGLAVQRVINHNCPNVKGMGMHPTFEIHMDKIWLS